MYTARQAHIEYQMPEDRSTGGGAREPVAEEARMFLFVARSRLLLTGRLLEVKKYASGKSPVEGEEEVFS